MRRPHPNCSRRWDLHFSGGKRTITKGPLSGSNELVAGYAIVKTAAIDEAIEFASRGARADAEIDVRPVTESWDLRFFPKPAGENAARLERPRGEDHRIIDIGRRADAGLRLLETNGSKWCDRQP